MKLGIYIICPAILAATEPLSELEPRMVLFNYELLHWCAAQQEMQWPRSYIAALLTQDEEIELYIRPNERSGYKRLPATAFGPEKELLAIARRAGRIHPQPISTHQMISDTALRVTLFGIKMLVGRRIFFLFQLFNSKEWNDPDRYSVISHWILVYSEEQLEIYSQLLLLDRTTGEIFTIAKNLYGPKPYERQDGKISKFYFGPDGLYFFGPGSQEGFTTASIRLEIDRGTIIPRPLGQHSIGVYKKRRGTVEVYNTDSSRVYRSAGHAGIDANVGPIAAFKQRKECLETFYGFVDPDVDELVAHIYRGGLIQLNVAFIRNRVTGKVRLLQKTNRLIRWLFGRFIEIPQWAQVDTIFNILIPSHSVNKMIEDGGLAPIPFAESDSHPVIEILTGNLPGYLEHSINHPDAKYYADASFNPIINYIFRPEE